MRREAAAALILVLTLSLPAGALPSPSPTFTPHAPISIASDADFTAANGVTGGTGTPADPFVVSGWSIQASSSTAIAIRNVTKPFVVRDNSISANLGVSVSATAVVGAVLNNKVVVRGVGVAVTDADALVANNSFVGDTSLGPDAQGVVLLRSNSVVRENAFIYTPTAIAAQQGSPDILCNDVHDDSVKMGIQVVYTTNATVACNVLTSCQTGIQSYAAIGTVIVNNTADECLFGIDVTLSKDVDVANNTIRLSAGVGLNLNRDSGNVTSNVVIDGQADGIVLTHSPLVLARNTVTNNLGVGIRLVDTSGDIDANLVSRNAVGIAFQGTSIAHLSGNAMTNNRVGIDLPYASRQAIPWMSGNFVNGVNVDGTVSSNDRVFFEGAANVTVTGGVRDSGFSLGYFGSISAQGNLVLYDVDTAHIDQVAFGHADAGVTAVNSFNVVVESSTIQQAKVGVDAYVVPLSPPAQALPCVVSVKNSTIGIPVDPPATVGVRATSCGVLLLNASISLVDTGVDVEAASSLAMVGSTVVSTRVGVSLAAGAGANLTGNEIAANAQGVVQWGGDVAYVDNRIHDNAGAGLTLANGAHATLLGNALLANGRGIVDTQPCGAPYSCGSLDAQANLVAQSAGDGVAVNGTTTWRGDAFQDNLGDGARLGTTTLVNVNASGNGNDGVEARGTFTLRSSAFRANARHGAYLVGSGDLRTSQFTDNVEAGIRASPAYITANDLDVEHNFDGILLDGTDAPVAPGVPASLSVQQVWALATISPLAADVMDIHHSSIVANERDGIRAGVASVNATSNWWGTSGGPSISVEDQVGAYRDGVSPTVRFVPYYTDPGMTTTGPVPLL